MRRHSSDQPNSAHRAPASLSQQAALVLLGLGTLLALGAGGVALFLVPPNYPWAIHNFPVSASVCGTWQTVAQPNIGLLVHYGWTNGVAVRSAEDAWIGGGLEDRDDNKQPLLVHWDGQHLQQVPVPNSGCYYNRVNDMAAIARDNAWAVGVGCEEAYILHWDGQGWARIPGPSNVRGLVELETVRAVAADDVWAAGCCAAASSLILHWDGRTWRTVPAPPIAATLKGMTALGKDDLWLVGAADKQTLTLHWDGHAWTQVSSPNPCRGGNTLQAVSGTGATDVWAVGACTNNLTNTYLYPPETLILHWDGRTWQTMPHPHPAPQGQLSGVVALAPDDVWAVGAQSGAGGGRGDQLLTLHWDGQQWREVPSPQLGQDASFSAATAQAPDTIWAVGEADGAIFSARFLRTPCPTP
jgi:hypothetical protein